MNYCSDFKCYKSESNFYNYIAPQNDSCKKMNEQNKNILNPFTTMTVYDLHLHFECLEYLNDRYPRDDERKDTQICWE